MARFSSVFLMSAVIMGPVAMAVPAMAQQPTNLLPAPPAPAYAPEQDRRAVIVEPLGNDTSAKAESGEEADTAQSPLIQPQLPPVTQAQPPVPAQSPAAPTVMNSGGAVPVATMEAGDANVMSLPPRGMPAWMVGVLVLVGAFIAGLCGIVTAMAMRRSERRERRRVVAATLATELETRRMAFDAVPLPPNVEAGVSFVSSVTSLAGIDAGFRSIQGQLHLLPEKLAAHVCVHYAAVQRVSDFVKGQSLAAAVRMLQANRLGGHPCPDAGTMRDAHVELGVAFRGVEKLVKALASLR